MATATMSPLELYRQVRDYERQSGLTLGQAAVLEVLADGPVTIGNLCEATHMGPSAATFLLDVMERNGLVRRVRSVYDRRAILVELV